MFVRFTTAPALWCKYNSSTETDGCKKFECCSSCRLKSLCSSNERCAVFYKYFKEIYNTRGRSIISFQTVRQCRAYSYFDWTIDLSSLDVISSQQWKIRPFSMIRHPLTLHRMPENASSDMKWAPQMPKYSFRVVCFQNFPPNGSTPQSLERKIRSREKRLSLTLLFSCCSSSCSQ